MNIAIRPTAGRDGIRVAVAGEIDVETAPRMKTALLDALGRHQLVIVDLSGVTFMDSQGLAALLVARKEAESRGGTLHLEGVPARILKILRLTQLDAIFTIVPTPGTS